MCTAWLHGLVVSVLGYETRGPGSIPGWALIFSVFFLPFLAFNAELLHSSKMADENDRNGKS